MGAEGSQEWVTEKERVGSDWSVTQEGYQFHNLYSFHQLTYCF